MSPNEVLALVARAKAEGVDMSSKGPILEEHIQHHRYQRARSEGKSHGEALEELHKDAAIEECAEVAAAVRKSAARAIDPDVIKPRAATSKELLRRNMPIAALELQKSGEHLDRLSALAALTTAQQHLEQLRKGGAGAEAIAEAEERLRKLQGAQ